MNTTVESNVQAICSYLGVETKGFFDLFERTTFPYVNEELKKPIILLLARRADPDSLTVKGFNFENEFCDFYRAIVSAASLGGEQEDSIFSGDSLCSGEFVIETVVYKGALSKAIENSAGLLMVTAHCNSEGVHDPLFNIESPTVAQVEEGVDVIESPNENQMDMFLNHSYTHEEPMTDLQFKMTHLP